MEKLTNKKKRPPSVWITQLILVLWSLIFLFSFLRGLLSILTGTVSIRQLFGLIIIGIILGIWGMAFWDLLKKTNRGRWLGVISLVIIWGFILYSQLKRTNGPIQPYQYNNDAQMAGARTVQGVINLLLAILVARLAFAKKVKEYFV